MPFDGQIDTGRITHLPQMHRDNPWKWPVRAGTTANGTFASAFDNGSTIDGISLVTGDRILVKDQTAAEENGIYVVQASGVPIRAYDLSDDNEPVGAVVVVQQGTVNQGKWFVCTATDPLELDVDDMDWEEFTGSGVSDHGALTGLSDNDHPQYLEFD